MVKRELRLDYSNPPVAIAKCYTLFTPTGDALGYKEMDKARKKNNKMTLIESRRALAQSHYTTAVQLPNLQILKEVEKIKKQFEPIENNSTLQPAHTPVAMQKAMIDSLKQELPHLALEIDQIGEGFDFVTESRKM